MLEHPMYLPCRKVRSGDNQQVTFTPFSMQPIDSSETEARQETVRDSRLESIEGALAVAAPAAMQVLQDRMLYRRDISTVVGPTYFNFEKK